MRPVAALLALALLVPVDCGEKPRGERLDKKLEAQLPTSLGALWELCPAPDVPQEFYDRESREARQATRALIRGVRRNANAVVTLVSYGAHDGKTYREPVTVRELAEEHLDNPGVGGVPCQRRLMLELRAAVGGRDQPPPDAAQNERVYTVEQIVQALGLRKDGAVYHGPEGCEIDSMYSSRSELEVALGDGAAGNHELVTDPDRTVGVEVYRPSAACVRELERRLAAFVAR